MAPAARDWTEDGAGESSQLCGVATPPTATVEVPELFEGRSPHDAAETAGLVAGGDLLARLDVGDGQQTEGVVPGGVPRVGDAAVVGDAEDRVETVTGGHS